MAEQEREEILVEVEAVEAVYGHECLVIQRFPPHLNVHIKPRTADDSSQQFVEAVICLQAGAQLHLHAVYAVLLSAILGFGISISLNSLCLYICARRPPQRRINSNSVR